MAQSQSDSTGPGILEYGQQPGTMERKPAARNFGSEQQERSKAQRSAAEDRRLLGRLHGRERHRNSWFEALAAGTEPHCGAQVEEGNHARNRPPSPPVPR